MVNILIKLLLKNQKKKMQNPPTRTVPHTTHLHISSKQNNT